MSWPSSLLMNAAATPADGLPRCARAPIADREFNPRLVVNGHCVDARRVGSTWVWHSPCGMSPSALPPTPRGSTLTQVGDLVHATILTRARS